jgi:hypothetical protein
MSSLLININKKTVGGKTEFTSTNKDNKICRALEKAMNKKTNYNIEHSYKFSTYYRQGHKIISRFAFIYTPTNILNEQMKDVNIYLQKLLKTLGPLNIEVQHFTNELSGSLYTECYIDISQIKNKAPKQIEHNIKVFADENFHQCFAIRMKKYYSYVDYITKTLKLCKNNENISLFS